MAKVQKPIARWDKIVTQDLKTETLVYDLEADKAFYLNETSTLVWKLCDGKHTVSQISDEMSKQMKNLVSEDVVWLALDQLSKDKLLENGDKLDFPFSGLSRREVIKRVGFASVVALPVISSLVAPQAVMAQSLAANGDACPLGDDSACISNNCLTVGGAGRCCDAGSTQSNFPGYTVCTTDGSAAAFAFRCCSGNASPSMAACLPSDPPGSARYICDPY